MDFECKGSKKNRIFASVFIIKMTMSMLMGREEINTGRQMSVDLAKVFSIVFMVAIHTLEGGDADMERGIAYVVDSVLGAQFGAPVFMVCMGIGMTYSRRADAATMLQRGWRLFVAGYLLNVVRALPFMMIWGFNGDAEAGAQVVSELLDVDILQFAGMAFLLLSLLKRWGFNMWAAGLIAVVMSLTGGLLQGVDLGNMVLNVVLSPLIGIKSVEVTSDFPLLNWFIFVMAGYGMGKVIRRCGDLSRLFCWLLPVAALLYGAYAWYAIPRGIGMFGSYEQLFYHMNLRDALVCVTAAVLAISLCHFLSRPLTEGLRAQVMRISSDITRIYVAQWIIIKWVVEALMTDTLELTLSTPQLLAVAAVILLLSICWARVKPMSDIKI